jgi:NADH-quinone oxidoreductase subunit I
MSLLGVGIFKGMMVTLKNFLGSYRSAKSSKHPLFTKQYAWQPDAESELPGAANEYDHSAELPKRDTTTVTEYSRNFPILLHDGDEGDAPMDTIRCVACQICERECPPQCIYIEKAYDENGKYIKSPAKFDIDVSVCMSCQICVEVCPFDAIVMDSQFELSTPNRFGGLLLRRDDLLKSNDYYHSIHPEEAAARDQKMADEKAAKEAKKKAAAEKAKAAAEKKAADEAAAAADGKKGDTE